MESYQQQVLTYSQSLVSKGYLSGTGGNISVRIPSEERIPGKEALAITPSNTDYMAMSVQDVCVYTFDGEKLSGELQPSIEMALHIAVYQSRPDVQCVIHTHQVYASTFSLLNMSIPALFDEQVRFLGRSVDIIPYAPSGTKFLRNKIKSHIDNHHNAYIMQNHGALCLGPTAERAVHNLMLLEKCAIAYLLTLCADKDVKRIPLAVREIAFAKLRRDQKRVEQQLQETTR